MWLKNTEAVATLLCLSLHDLRLKLTLDYLLIKRIQMYEKKTGMRLFHRTSSPYNYSILMKLSLILPLLLTANMYVSALTFGQNFTLNKKGIQVEVLLNELQRQTGYNIFYDEAIVPTDA